ncbi:hypothetical protein PGB90_001466 [Kerria lacca]
MGSNKGGDNSTYKEKVRSEESGEEETIDEGGNIKNDGRKKKIIKLHVSSQIQIMIFLTLICVSMIILLWIYTLITPSSVLLKYGNKIPGPKPLPIIGNVLLLQRAKNFLGVLNDMCRLHGSVYRLWIGKQLFIVLSNPTDIESFLSRTSNLNKSDSYRTLNLWLGTQGLITAERNIWRIHRKQISPSFYVKMLENATPMMAENAKIFCEQIEPKVGQTECEIQEFIIRCSFDIMCEAAMGIKFQTQIIRDCPYFSSVKKVCSACIKRVYKPWLHNDFIFSLFKEGRNFKKHLAILEDEFQKGHDTTASAMSFCLFSLSKNPIVQDKVVEELKNKSFHTNSKLTYNDYMNLKYLDLVIKETLRMFPTVPTIGRKVETEIKIPSGYVIPTNSLVNFHFYHMHNNEKLFPNPEEFIPERFQNDNVQPYSFLPFSAGPRNCIGQKFAILEMKIILSTVLLKYELLPAANMKSITLEQNLTLISKNKLLLKEIIDVAVKQNAPETLAKLDVLLTELKQMKANYEIAVGEALSRIDYDTDLTKAQKDEDTILNDQDSVRNFSIEQFSRIHTALRKIEGAVSRSSLTGKALL